MIQNGKDILGTILQIVWITVPQAIRGIFMAPAMQAPFRTHTVVIARVRTAGIVNLLSVVTVTTAI